MARRLRALGLFFVDAHTGKKEALARQTAAFEAAGFREAAPLVMAGIYAQAREREKMYALLEHCVSTHARRTPQINISPVFDPYRDEPRFLELRKRAGFVP